MGGVADILAQRRDELSHASIESAVLPSLPPRQPTHEDEVIMRNAEQPNSAWGRSRFSNGRDFNTEFIRSQQNAEAPPLPLSGPPEPQEPNANALPDKLPDRVKSPDQLADRREKSVHALVNSYQRMASARGAWDGQQQQSRHNNNWHSVETTSHFYTTNELDRFPGKPKTICTVIIIDRTSFCHRSSGESELSVSGVSKDKKDKKGVFGGLFSRKKRPQSHM
ncbi:hypothetical protein ACJJTC_011307 [Scirpophaga incertulas]